VSLVSLCRHLLFSAMTLETNLILIAIGASIGHRGGGTLFFPEETVESTMAGARMGAGILECDVSFTSDRVRDSPCISSKTVKSEMNLARNLVLSRDMSPPLTDSHTTSIASSEISIY
jgi:glycerophosphoryl diester phosphodiesterase